MLEEAVLWNVMHSLSLIRTCQTHHSLQSDTVCFVSVDFLVLLFENFLVATEFNYIREIFLWWLINAFAHYGFSNKSMLHVNLSNSCNCTVISIPRHFWVCILKFLLDLRPRSSYDSKCICGCDIYAVYLFVVCSLSPLSASSSCTRCGFECY